jgi:hypothetical protein
MSSRALGSQALDDAGSGMIENDDLAFCLRVSRGTNDTDNRTLGVVAQGTDRLLFVGG